MANQHNSEARHWPVLLACFFTTFLSFGTASTMGVFYVEWRDEFQESSAVVGWLSSSMFASMMCFSPTTGALIKYFGIRPVVTVGAVLSSCGLFIASFAHGISVLFITIPFMTGIGFSMCYTSIIATVSEHFHKHYAFANSVAMSGASVGMIPLPFLFRFLIDEYGWRGALMVVSALQCNVLAFAVAIKPLQSVKRKKRSARSDHLSVRFQGEGRDGSVQFLNRNLKIQNDEPLNDTTLGKCEAAENDTVVNDALLASTSHSCVTTMSNVQTRSPDENKPKTINCRQYIVSFLDHSGLSLLWTNRVYSSFLIVIGLGAKIYGVTLPYVVAHANSVNIPILESTFLVSVIGIGNIVTRLPHGWLVDAKIIHETYIYVFSLSLALIAGPVFSVMKSYVGFVVCAALVGMSAGVFISLQAVMVRQIVGKERFPGAFGVALVTVAVGNMVSSTVGGYLLDATGSYSAAFNYMGSMAGIAAVLVLSLHILWTRLIPDARWPKIDGSCRHF